MRFLNVRLAYLETEMVWAQAWKASSYLPVTDVNVTMSVEVPANRTYCFCTMRKPPFPTR